MAIPDESEESESQKPSGQELKQDELIEKLVPDPAAPPDVVVLRGFLGKSSQPGYWRLYLTPQLNQYVEILEGDVVLQRTVAATGQNFLEHTMLWVKRHATLHLRQTVSRQVQAGFLRGNIMNTSLPRTGIAGLSRAALRSPSISFTFLWFCDPGCCETSTFVPDPQPPGLALAACTPTFACPPTQDRVTGDCCSDTPEGC